MKRFFRYINAWIQTLILAPGQKSKRAAVRATELALIKMYPEPVVGPFPDFPEYQSVLSERKQLFSDYLKSGSAAKSKYRPVMIGNSIGEGARKWMFSIDKRVNFCKSGFWIHHMQKLYTDMKPMWDGVGYNPDVFIVETPGGNNLLQRQEVNNVIEQFIDFLNLIRHDYPKARIIIGDLPSSIVNYIILNKPKVTQSICEWVMNDGNACVLLFVKRYVAKNKILPMNHVSLEGVHMTPLGSIILDDEVNNAMSNKSLKFIL